MGAAISSTLLSSSKRIPSMSLSSQQQQPSSCHNNNRIAISTHSFTNMLQIIYFFNNKLPLFIFLTCSSGGFVPFTFHGQSTVLYMSHILFFSQWPAGFLVELKHQSSRFGNVPTYQYASSRKRCTTGEDEECGAKDDSPQRVRSFEFNIKTKKAF